MADQQVVFTIASDKKLVDLKFEEQAGDQQDVRKSAYIDFEITRWGFKEAAKLSELAPFGSPVFQAPLIEVPPDWTPAEDIDELIHELGIDVTPPELSSLEVAESLLTQ